VDGDEPRFRADDHLQAVVRQDLDPLSVAELEARIVTLEGEIARSRAKIQFAVNHKASAESLFKS
jgi:uncharacterized small protein (DUF1192 family)